METVLAGFTVKTFTRRIRYAYIRAFVRRFNIAQIRRVILTNIRASAAARRHLGDGHQQLRVLATSSGVTFDIQVATDTKADADAFKATVKGGGVAEDAAILVDFKTEIAAVAAGGEYEDVESNYVVPSQLAVATQRVVVGVATGAPTPAPTSAGGGSTPGDGAGFPVIPVAAGAGALFAIAAVAGLMRRRAGPSRGKRPDHPPQTETLDDSVEMFEVENPSADTKPAPPHPLRDCSLDTL